MTRNPGISLDQLKHVLGGFESSRDLLEMITLESNIAIFAIIKNEKPNYFLYPSHEYDWESRFQFHNNSIVSFDRGILEKMKSILKDVPLNSRGLKRMWNITKYFITGEFPSKSSIMGKEFPKLIEEMKLAVTEDRPISLGVLKDYFAYGSSTGRPKIRDRVAETLVRLAEEHDAGSLKAGLPSDLYAYSHLYFIPTLNSIALLLMNILSDFWNRVYIGVRFNLMDQKKTIEASVGAKFSRTSANRSLSMLSFSIFILNILQSLYL